MNTIDVTIFRSPPDRHIDGPPCDLAFVKRRSKPRNVLARPESSTHRDESNATELVLRRSRPVVHVGSDAANR